MSIKEIWIPEALAVLFLVIPLFRPFIKGLRSLDGVAWLPLIALGILVGIFPAYGFRPEVIPVLVFAVFFNLANLFSFIANAMGRQNDSLQERGPFRTIVAMVLLVAVAVPMFAFAPQVYTRYEREIEPVRSLTVQGEFLSYEYVLRIYGPVQANRPLIFIVPPEIGAAASVELICENLQAKGFTVVTYFRRDLDTLFIDESGKRHLFPIRILRYWRIFRRATDLAVANERGRVLEDARQSDLEFLLPRLPALLGVMGRADLPPMLFVGYGAGGSALAYMAVENGFLDRHGNVLGVMAIESQLWSSYLNIPRTIEPLTDTGMIPRLQTNVANWFHGRRRQRVSRTGPLPEPGLPVLYLVSGRALDTGRRQRAYQAVFDAMRYGYGPVALAAIESAGPLDYQDYPLTHPLLSFFFSGLRGAGRSENPIADTAGIIGNFASFLLERKQMEQDRLFEQERFAGGEFLESSENDIAEAGETEQEMPARWEIDIPPRSAIMGTVYIESRGLPGFRL
ncbi:MAG: hypothetical protein FWE42_09220 [Defluviitaleaceae bacterium]|nr:hypothetical protein [Defluviitaleaceae bacterium]